MILLLVGVACVFSVAAFARLRSVVAVAVLAIAAGAGLILSDIQFAALGVLFLRVQSEDADVLRWACNWIPNGGPCINDLRGFGWGSLALPVSVASGVAVRQLRAAPTGVAQPDASQLTPLALG